MPTVSSGLGPTWWRGKQTVDCTDDQLHSFKFVSRDDVARGYCERCEAPVIYDPVHHVALSYTIRETLPEDLQ